MPRRAERHALARDGRIGLFGEIGRHQPRNIRQHGSRNGFAGERMDVGHGGPLVDFPVIASGAKQSRIKQKVWIASSLALLAMTTCQFFRLLTTADNANGSWSKRFLKPAQGFHPPRT